jgi:GDP-4-dehydro-6-deoxy-D-mannose reductase
VSKAQVDLLAGFYADAHGLSVLRARAFNHAGPGQSHAYVVSSFARQVAEAEARGARGEDPGEIVTGNLEPRRDVTDVRDVARAYDLALDAGLTGPVNVCSGRAVPVAELLEGLLDRASVAVAHREDPARARPHEVMEVRGSHRRLAEATGWRPEIPLERTLLDTLEWWRERVATRPAAEAPA